MRLVAEQNGGILVVRAMEDRIDAACAIQFKDRMREITQDNSPRVVLDMSNVGFLDSSGLGAVVAVMKALGPVRRLELSGLTATVDILTGQRSVMRYLIKPIARGLAGALNER